MDDSVKMDVTGLFGVERIEPKRRGKKPRLTASRTKFGPKEEKKVIDRKNLPKLPVPKCALCPLGDSPDYPLMPTDSLNVYAHVECAAHVLEPYVEILNHEIAAAEGLVIEQEPAEDVASTAANAADITLNVEGDASIIDPSMVIEVAQRDVLVADSNDEPSGQGQEPVNEEIPAQAVDHEELMAIETLKEFSFPSTRPIRQKKLYFLPNSNQPAPYLIKGIRDIPDDRWKLVSLI